MKPIRLHFLIRNINKYPLMTDGNGDWRDWRERTTYEIWNYNHYTLIYTYTYTLIHYTLIHLYTYTLYTYIHLHLYTYISTHLWPLLSRVVWTINTHLWPLLSRVVWTINLEYGRLYTVLYCNVLYSTVLYCTVLYRTIMCRTVLYYNKKVRNFQIRRAGISYCE